ncbi:MAG: FecR family protein [Betaproteobacteria bacterium]|jgi:hypothetical protein
MSRLFASGYSCLAAVMLITFVFVTEAFAEGGAATAQFVFGSASLVRADGSSVPLTRGNEIGVGDSVTTGADGRVHLRFTDGGFVALTPGSEFRVNAYSYSGKSDGTERASLALLKGGLRTVSGLIGKISQQAYEMVTRVATIGIRGTEYTVVYAEGISGSVGHGRIEVCNAGGCLEVASGESYYVKDEKTKPARAAKAAELRPPQPTAKTLDVGDVSAPTKLPDAVLTQAGPVFAAGTENRTDPPAYTGGGQGGAGGTVPGSEPGGVGSGGNPGGGNTGGGSPGGGNGGSSGAGLGIGFVLIGSTAPNVDGPVKGGVSDFVNNANKGWGAGGNPLNGRPR